MSAAAADGIVPVCAKEVSRVIVPEPLQRRIALAPDAVISVW